MTAGKQHFLLRSVAARLKNNREKTTATQTAVFESVGECLSPRFVAAMRRCWPQATAFVATVALKGEGLIDEAKRWPGATLWEVTHDNRDRMPDEALA